MITVTTKNISLMLLTSLLTIGCSSGDTNSKSIMFNKPDYKLASDLNVQMGEKYFKDGQYARAKTKLLHAIKLQPDSPSAHSAIAYFYENIGELSLAKKHHELSIKHGNNAGTYYNNYANFLCRRHEYKKADQVFNLALADQQLVDTSIVYENAGSCALEANNDKTALYYFTKAFNHDPSKTHLRLPLAKLNHKLGQNKDALALLELYQKSVELTPEILLLSIKIKTAENNTDANVDAMKLRNLFPGSKEMIEYNELIAQKPNQVEIK